MSRATAVRLRTGLVALLVLIFGLSSSLTQARAVTTTDPLTITIDSMTSSPSGDILLSGRITNLDDQPWREINILPFVGRSPIQTPEGLASATQTPENVDVGHRIPTVYTIIHRLDPGATTTWSLTVPSSEPELPHAVAGVYWFGVHALGTSSAGVSKSADGRARTFLPVVGSTSTPARVHLIVEITEPIGFDARGYLMRNVSSAVGAPTWASEFGGHLAALLSVVNDTPGADLLVDPAVIDAASALADGNPGWLGVPAPRTDTKAAAQAWLASFKAVAKTHQVWALPYGDVDVAATADRPDIVAAAEKAARPPFEALGVRAAPARRSPDLTASAAVVNGAPASTAFVDARIAGSLADADSVRVVGTAVASLGGPKPGAPYDEVALRQQILAEAALHVGTTAPVVVVIPSAFSPADPAGFAESLAQPWVSLESLPQALAGRTVAAFPNQSHASPATPLVQLSVNAYDAAVASAGVLQRMTGTDVVGAVTRSALTALSRAAVHGPTAENVRFGVDDLLLKSVALTAPPGVTLSGTSGRFLVSLANKLPVPVTVNVRTSTDPDTAIGHFTSQTLQAHGAGSVLVNVSLNTHGNHRVTFSLTDSSGRPIGITADVTVRSVQVSGLIWAFIAAGLGLLGLAIALRLIRRIRSTR